MAVSDNKKCQTLINITAAKVIELKAIATKLNTLRDAFLAQGVDPTGTPLDGHVGEISTWIDNVELITNNAIPNGFIAAVVPTHRNKALGGI